MNKKIARVIESILLEKYSSKYARALKNGLLEGGNIPTFPSIEKISKLAEMIDNIIEDMLLPEEKPMVPVFPMEPAEIIVNFRLIPSRYDSRDHKYKQQQVPIKREVDLRQWDSIVENQEDLGSCAGNAITNAYELLVKQKYPEQFKELSRLFVYYNARFLENNTETDTGVMELRSVLKAAKIYGICEENIWPYNVDKFNIKPNDEAYNDATKRKITEYKSLSTHNDMLEALNADVPIIIGTYIYNDFLELSKEDPVIKLADENSVYTGAHAMVIVGYSLSKQQFLIKNSFGMEWGDNGYCWMPFKYAKENVFDKWIFSID